jgi:cytoskeletal protein CcmA (bactofilin family)
MASSNNSPHEQVSILGHTLRFKGELHADEDVVIHGHVEGSITHTQRLTICRDGHVKANIQGHVIAVEGVVVGDLHASTSVAIMETGQLTGDVEAPSVSVVEGASVNGIVTMDGSKRAGRIRRSSGGRPTVPAEPVRGNGTGNR